MNNNDYQQNKQHFLKTTCTALALSALLTIGLLPAQARFDWNNWQPAIGAVHQDEDYLNTRLNQDYTRGLIDWNEKAQMQRDLDGIAIQEDEFRMDHNGLGTNDVKWIMNKITQFERNLDRAERDKAPQVAVITCN